MTNLASSRNRSPERVAETDTTVIKELTEAGITCIVNPEVSEGEVPTRICGQIGSFSFKRLWYYWSVAGRVPLSVAEKLYADEIGKQDVRVAGHCGCPAPKDWVIMVDVKTGRIVTSDEEWQKGLKLFADMPKALADWKANYIPTSEASDTQEFVDSYHIDSQMGLNLFVSTLKTHGLV